MASTAEKTMAAHKRAAGSVVAADQQEAIEYYDKTWAKHYENDLEAWKATGYNSYKTALSLLQQFATNKDVKILDIAAGTGELGTWFQNNGFSNLYALDGSIEMIKIAQSKQIYKEIYHEILEADTPSKVVPQKSFDFVFALSCFYPKHLEGAHIPALLSMLKPGGKLIIGFTDHYSTELGLETKIEEFRQQGLGKIIVKQQIDYVFDPEKNGWKPGTFFVVETV